MIIPSTGVTISKVKEALQASTTDLGTLCKHTNVIPWSKWKPVSSEITTMTLEELIRLNYGIEIIKANNLDDLISRVNTNGGKGFIYHKPFGGRTSPYRLGDFRNYDNRATVPVGTTYQNNDVVEIGGTTSGADKKFYEVPIASAESVSSDTTLGADELYIHYTDPNGQRYTLHRGAIVTNKMVGDPVTKVFFSNNFYWWDRDVQKLKGSIARIYECYTNAEGSGDFPYDPNAGDIFLALPFSRYDVQLSAKEPIKPTLAGVEWDPRFLIAGDYTRISYSLTITSIGDAYTGGQLDNITVEVCTDRAGNHSIASDNSFGSFLLGSEDSRTWRFKSFILDGNTNPDLYLVIWWNNKKQYVVNVRYNVDPNA